MKNWIELQTFILLLSCTSSIASAQFALINDKDGFCYVRNSATKGNNIVGKLENGQIVYCFPGDGNWMDVDYLQGGEILNGVVYKDRVKFISDYQNIPVFKEQSNKIHLKKDSIIVVVTSRRFDKTKHRFSYYKDNKEEIERIDNQQYWGYDGGVPTTEYQSVEITIGQRKINLPNAALKNLYEPSLYNTVVNYDQAKDILYIQSSNSDGAGSYEVIWRIEKGVYKDRSLMYGF